MRETEIKIHDEIKNLYLSVYFIGYENEGESSVLILYSTSPKKRIVYSMVIDCYEDEQVNCTEKILEKFEEDFPTKKKKDKKIKINMLVWTHPHRDHTKGIGKLIDWHCNKSTKIVTANILNTGKKYAKECDLIIHKIAHLNDRQKKRWNISSTETLESLLQKIEFFNAKDLISTLKIRCIAPVSDIIAKDISDSEINKLSVGIVVEIERNDGNMNFLFAADIENPTFQEIANEQELYSIPSRYTYIKLPHHGGKSADSLVKLLDVEEKSDFAVTSVYNKTEKIGNKEIIYRNPDKKTIKKYKNYIDNIGATSDIFNGESGIGVLKVDYNLLEREMNINTYGTAVKKIV